VLSHDRLPLFRMISVGDFIERFAVTLVTVNLNAFGQMQEIAPAVEGRRVFSKLHGYGLLRTLPFAWSVAVAAIPLAFVENAAFGVVVYYMTDYASESVRVFTFIALLWCSSLAIGALFRVFANAAAREETAAGAAGPAIGLFLMYGGFFLTASHIPDFAIWIYWLSPFSWSVRALAINEFHAERYGALVGLPPANLTLSSLLLGNGTRIPSLPAVTTLGDRYLAAYEMKTEDAYIWGAALLLIGYFLVFNSVAALVLRVSRLEAPRGTARLSLSHALSESTVLHNGTGGIRGTATAPTPVVPSASVAVNVVVPMPAPTAAATAATTARGAAHNPHSAADSADPSELPAPPRVGLRFESVSYSITDDALKERTLLANVCGRVRCGEMLALMGATGAGKVRYARRRPPSSRSALLRSSELPFAVLLLSAHLRLRSLSRLCALRVIVAADDAFGFVGASQNVRSHQRRCHADRSAPRQQRRADSRLRIRRRTD
jgi:hypothetical protein